MLKLRELKLARPLIRPWGMKAKLPPAAILLSCLVLIAGFLLWAAPTWAQTRVQTNVCKSTGLSSTTCTWNAATGTGNLLLMVVAVQNNTSATITVASPWVNVDATNYPYSPGTPAPKVGMWYMANAATRSAPETVTLDTARDTMITLIEVSGMAASGVVDVDWRNGATGIGSPIDSGTTATTTQANEYWLAVGANRNTTTPGAATGGFTNITPTTGTNPSITGGTTTNAIGYAVADQIVSATGTAHATWPLGTNRPRTGIVATFHAAVVCSAPPDASYVAANAQSGQAIVYWASSNPALILRKPTTAFTTDEIPADGSTYTAGISMIGSATVVYNGSVAETSLTQTGLTNGTTYYYKVFAKNSTPCYAPGISVTARPAAGPDPAWSYMMANGSTMRGGIAGQGIVNTAGNFARLISLNTANGTQTWAPVATTAAVQGWLTWLPNAYPYRLPLTVTAGFAAVPTGYSVLVTINHASLVSAGKSQASGNDVRVFYWNGASWVQLDRVLDSGSAWNSATTKIWFKTQAAIAASGTDSNYYLYYGNPTAAGPPANKANVFLFADDFEGGTLSNWTILSGGWQAATDQKHGGTYSLKYPTESGTSDKWIFANPALNIDNVYLDTWWRFSALDPANARPDMAQLFRADGIGSNDYEANLEGQSSTREGWDIAKTIGGTWSWLNADTVSTAAANTWTRIGTAIYGTGMRVFKDGTQINPTSGSFNVGGELASGNIGFHKWNMSSGAWWVDDVIVRRYVDPEPTAAPGTEQATMAGVVIGGDQSGRVYAVDATSGGLNWSVTLTGADAVQAPVAAQLQQWSNAAFNAAYTDDVLFAATRNSSTTTNKLFALKAMDGTVLWSFNGTIGSYSVDYIVGMPWVDYTRNRLYVTSCAGSSPGDCDGSGTQASLWVINSLTGALVTSFSLGDIQASPTMSVDGKTVYVGTTSGRLYAVDMSTLALKWSGTGYVDLGTNVAVQGFIWENGDIPGRLYFATSGTTGCTNGCVWSLQDPGAEMAPPNPASPLWKTAVASPSTPLPMDKLYVGSSDGKVHQLDLTSGVDEKQFTVGSGAYQVGDVSTETGSEIFVPTTEGTLYKLPLPLP